MVKYNSNYISVEYDYESKIIINGIEHEVPYIMQGGNLKIIDDKIYINGYKFEYKTQENKNKVIEKIIAIFIAMAITVIYLLSN